MTRGSRVSPPLIQRFRKVPLHPNPHLRTRTALLFHEASPPQGARARFRSPCRRRAVQKKGVHIYIYIHTHTYKHTCIYIYIYVYTAVSPARALRPPRVRVSARPCRNSCSSLLTNRCVIEQVLTTRIKHQICEVPSMNCRCLAVERRVARAADVATRPVPGRVATTATLGRGGSGGGNGIGSGRERYP